MGFILWLLMVVGGAVLQAQNPEPFDGAYLAGSILFWVGIVMAVLNAIILVIITFWMMRD